jgi:hypothetical protein
MVKPGFYDRSAKRFEARHIESDVVIDEENRPRTVVSGVAYVV